LVAVSERIQVTSIFVTDSDLAIVSVTTLLSFASVIPWRFARMGGIRIGIIVCLPNIELGTAASVIALIVVPILGVGLSVDKFDVMWTLGVTIASSIFRSGLIAWIFGGAAILQHLHEV
jgi:xanthosine utilization system XapX-like protein